MTIVMEDGEEHSESELVGISRAGGSSPPSLKYFASKKRGCVAVGAGVGGPGPCHAPREQSGAGAGEPAG